MRRKVWRFESSLGHQQVVGKTVSVVKENPVRLEPAGFLLLVVRGVSMTSGFFRVSFRVPVSGQRQDLLRALRHIRPIIVRRSG